MKFYCNLLMLKETLTSCALKGSQKAKRDLEKINTAPIEEVMQLLMNKYPWVLGE